MVCSHIFWTQFQVDVWLFQEWRNVCFPNASVPQQSKFTSMSSEYPLLDVITMVWQTCKSVVVQGSLTKLQGRWMSAR